MAASGTAFARATSIACSSVCASPRSRCHARRSSTQSSGDRMRSSPARVRSRAGSRTCLWPIITGGLTNWTNSSVSGCDPVRAALFEAERLHRRATAAVVAPADEVEIVGDVAPVAVDADHRPADEDRLVVDGGERAADERAELGAGGLLADAVTAACRRRAGGGGHCSGRARAPACSRRRGAASTRGRASARSAG